MNKHSNVFMTQGIGIWDHRFKSAGMRKEHDQLIFEPDFLHGYFCWLFFEDTSVAIANSELIIGVWRGHDSDNLFYYFR